MTGVEYSIPNTNIYFCLFLFFSCTLIKQMYGRMNIRIVILSPVVKDGTFNNRFTMMTVDDIDDDRQTQIQWLRPYSGHRP